MKLKCINCNCDFEKPQEQKTCSRKCSDEQKKKNNREKRNCVHCDREFEVKKKSKTKICSDLCRKEWALIPSNKEKRISNGKITLKEKYGIENIFVLDEIKNKSKQTKKERYGDENFTNTEKGKQTKKERYGDENFNNVEKNKKTKKENHGNENYNNREKAVNTMNELYGVDYAIQKYEFKDKQKKTNLEKYGVEYPLQSEKIQEKYKKTNLEKFGVEYPSQLDEIKEKVANTNLKLYGVSSLLKSKEVRDLGKLVMVKKYGTSNVMQLKKFKDKRRKTNLEKYGVAHPMQTFSVLQKNHISGFRIKKYKNSEITYQGSYELYFLELLEGKGLLSEIKSGQSFEYFVNNTSHIYHTDFTFKGKQIEIKSGWTYNKNGKDKELQSINDLKWAAARLKTDLIILIGKDEIKGFIKAL